MATFATYQPHLRGLLLLGLPLVGSHLAQVVIGITDALMLGWYDPAALAAATLGHSMWFVLFIVGSGFAMAVLPMIASAVAADESTQVRRVTRMGLWLSAIYGLVVMIPLIWAEPILRAIGQEAETAALAQDYLFILAFGMLPALFVMVLKSYLSALERTGPVLWITLITAVMNVGVNYLLIFGNWGFPELGVKGAAIASFSVHMVGFIAFCIYAVRVTPEHELFTRLWRSDWDAFARVFRLGWPIGLTVLGESGLFSASAIMMGWIGVLPLAAHGIVLQLASLTFVIHLGFSQAATVRAGAAYARKDFAGLRDGARMAIALSFSIAAVTVALFLLVPELLVSAFIDPNDPAKPQILLVGVSILAMAALFQVVDGLQVIMLGLLRGLQDTRTPMIFATISYWLLGMPASYLFGFVLDFGARGVWLGLVIGLAAAAISLFLRFWGQIGRMGPVAA